MLWIVTEYLLASDDELSRLQLQARVWEGEVVAALERVGVTAGATCLDLGCGAMGILGPLARSVGPSGRVVGVDRDASLLAAARHYLDSEGLTEVELLHGDALRSGLPYGTFDLVHERFVFPHVRDPEALLREMIALAVPGGTVLVQEPDHHSWHLHPHSPEWSRLLAIAEAGLGLRGDINIGRRTFGMLRDAGLERVEVRAAVLALQDAHPYMSMLLVAVEALRGRIVSAGLASDAELDDLMAKIETRITDPDTFQTTFTVTQVWGRKRAVDEAG